MPTWSRVCAATVAVLACCAFAKGERQPAEHKVFAAPESGLEVVQLTTHAADDSVLYFTGESFTADGQGLVFASRRSGTWELFRMDLRTFESVQLTQSRRGGGPSSILAAGSGEVVFRDGQDVKAVDLGSMAERAIATAAIPQGFYLAGPLSVTRDGRTVAFAISENIQVTTRTDKIYSDMDERFEKRPWSSILIGKADGTDWRELARQQKWISHTLVNPRDPKLVLYCHEGHWHKVEQRMWLVGADGAGNRPLRPEETPAVQIGHEYWFEDGVRVGYHGRNPDTRTFFVGVADTRTGEFREYALPHSETHTHADAEGALFVGDGSEKEPYLTLYRLAGGKLEETRLLRHGGSFSRQEWHPHPRFSPDGRSIVFTSSREGNGDVYLIRLPPELR